MNRIKLTVNELFSGLGAQKRGIDLTGLFDCEIVSTSDIDKDVIVSYATIHCGLTKELINTYNSYPSKEEMAKYLSKKNIGYDFKNNKHYDWNKHIKQKNKTLEKYYLACILTKNLGDISKIQHLPYADLWTYSFPCQDISVAGKGLGIKKGTRSGLLFEVERLLEGAISNNTQPNYLLLENVKNLVGKGNIDDFNLWLKKLDEFGYNTYWQVINGKNCGIPQNRERVFAISIRKNIDTGLFEFNKPFDNGLRLKDILEDDVDEKYYISDDKLDRFITELNKNALMYDSCQVKREGKSREYNEYSPTLRSERNGLKVANKRIRKLTPTECFRLMGFKDEDIKRCINMDISDTQLYKQAGNSIITYCIMLLMEHLYKAQYDNTYICTDEKILNKDYNNEKHKPVLIGGIGEKNFGKQYRQGNRIYDSNAIAMCLNAEPLGNTGGYSYLYLVQNPICIAMRGRYNSHGVIEQKLEPRFDGVVNTLTTVEKDNYIMIHNT